MQQLSVPIVLLALLQACSSFQHQSSMSESPRPFTNSPQPEVVSISSTSEPTEVEFNLSDYQWQNRVMLIFAPAEQSSAYQQQRQQWQSHTEDSRDRDLKLVEVLGTGGSQADGSPITAASAERLRQQFGVTQEDFAVILVGKDGTEKQRESSPVDPTVFFRTIDTMPMRQQEIRSRQ